MTENKEKIGYRKLIAWQKIKEFTVFIYRIYVRFLKGEIITAKIRPY